MSKHLKKLTNDALLELVDDLTREYERRELQEIEDDEDQIYSRHISEFKEEALEIAKNPYKIRGIATGYPILDQFLCGLSKGELTAISADTSVGKTLFTLNLINKAYKAMAQPFTTLYISLDTAIINVCARFYTMHDFPEAYPIYFYNNTIGISLEKIKKAIKMRQEESGLDLVVVDMLNSLVRSVIGQASEMASVTLKLRELALELGIHIIILCHITKEVSRSRDIRPHYSAIKDSSAVAQDSDVVIMLGRNNLDLNERNTMIVSVQKNRNKGRTGELAMHIDWKTLNMYEVEVQRDEAQQY